MEEIDLGGFCTLAFSSATGLLNLSGTSNTLQVKGASVDAVAGVAAAGFVQQADTVVDGANYHACVNGEAVLLVAVAIYSPVAYV